MIDGFAPMGKMLIVLGFLIIVFGMILILSDKIPFLGKLPGDIMIKRKNIVFYFPIVTCLLLSLVLTFILYLLRK